MENEKISTSPPSVIKTGEWMWTLLIASIPLIGIIMMFVWAFSAGENPSKANWAKAILLWMLIGLILGGLILILFLSVFSSLTKSIGGGI